MTKLRKKVVSTTDTFGSVDDGTVFLTCICCGLIYTLLQVYFGLFDQQIYREINMSDEFVFVFQRYRAAEEAIRDGYIRLEDPDEVGRYLLAYQMIAEQLEEFFANPEAFEIKPTPVPVDDAPVIIAEADVWTEALQQIGWNDFDSFIEARPTPVPVNDEGAWTPYMGEIEMFADFL